MNNYIRAKIMVSGVVQGVGFRFFTLRSAQALGLTGYVRNKMDGSVEIVAEGSEDAINSFIDEVKIGPRAASVSDITLQKDQYKAEFEQFRVRH